MALLSETYVEQLVRSQRNGRRALVCTGCIWGALLLAFVGFEIAFTYYQTFAYGGYVMAACALAGIGLVFYGFKFSLVEYEYSFAAGEFEVVRILGMSRRKKKLDFPLGKITIMYKDTPENKASIQKRSFNQKYDFTSGVKDRERWFIFTATEGGVMNRVLIEPKPKMMDAIRLVVPDSKIID